MLKFIYFCFTLIFTVFLSNQDLFAQREAANWHFGKKVGLNFGLDKKVEIIQSSISTTEGCSSISDKDGDLLFYTDGTFVYDRNHKLMPNGLDLFGNSTSTQSAMIAKLPQSENIFYIFTADGDENIGASYSIVDMSLNSGFGDVVNKNIPLFKNSTEKLTATVHKNKSDIWIVFHEWGNNKFRSYLLSQNGLVATPVISNVGTEHKPNGLVNQDKLGQMKINPQGNKLGLVKYLSSDVELFDFDNFTGIVSNGVNITTLIDKGAANNNAFLPFNSPYGCEFSPNGIFFYFSSNITFQVDIDKIVGNENDYKLWLKFMKDLPNIGALQLSIDGKIYKTSGLYYTKRNGIDYSFIIGINNPNSVIDEQKLDTSMILIPIDNFRSVELGLPNFISSYFDPDFNNNDCTFDCDIKLGDTIVRVGENACIDLEIKINCPKMIEPNILTDFKIKLVYNPLVFAINKSLHNVISETLVAPDRMEIELLFENINFANDTSQIFQICGKTFLSDLIMTTVVVDSISFNNTKLQNTNKTIKNGSIALIHCNFDCDIKLSDTIVRAGDNACVNFEMKINCPDWTTPEIVTDFRIKLVYNPLVFEIDKTLYNVINETLVAPDRMEIELLFENINFANDTSQIFQICGKTFLSDFTKTDVILESIIFDMPFLSKINTTIKNGSVATIYCNYVCDIKIADTIVVAGEDACIDFELKINCPDWTTPNLLTDFKIKLVYNPLVFAINNTLYNVISENLIAPDRMEIELLFENINFANDKSQILQLCGTTYQSNFSKTTVVLDSIYFYSLALQDVNKTIKNGSVELTYCDFICDISIGDTTVSTGEEACIDLEIKIKCPKMMSQISTDFKIKLVYNPTVFMINKTLYTFLSETLVAPDRMEIEILFKDIKFANDTSQKFQICGKTYLSEFIMTTVVVDSIYFYNTALQNVSKSIVNGSVKLSHCLGTLRFVTFKPLLDVKLYFNQNEKNLSFNILNKNEECNLDYQIVDIIGNSVNCGVLHISGFSDKRYNLNLESLSPGLYFVFFNSGLLNKSEKLLIYY